MALDLDELTKLFSDFVAVCIGAAIGSKLKAKGLSVKNVHGNLKLLHAASGEVVAPVPFDIAEMQDVGYAAAHADDPGNTISEHCSLLVGAIDSFQPMAASAGIKAKKLHSKDGKVHVIPAFIPYNTLDDEGPISWENELDAKDPDKWKKAEFIAAPQGEQPLFRLIDMDSGTPIGNGYIEGIEEIIQHVLEAKPASYLRVIHIKSSLIIGEVNAPGPNGHPTFLGKVRKAKPGTHACWTFVGAPGGKYYDSEAEAAEARAVVKKANYALMYAIKDLMPKPKSAAGKKGKEVEVEIKHGADAGQYQMGERVVGTGNTFVVSPGPTASGKMWKQLKPLLAAEGLFYPVRGTSEDSVYWSVAKSPQVSVAVRRTATGFAMRLEGEGLKTTALVSRLNEAGTFKKAEQGHYSCHLSVTGVKAEMAYVGLLAAAAIQGWDAIADFRNVPVTAV